MSFNPPRSRSASHFDPPNSPSRTHPPDNLLIDLSDDNHSEGDAVTATSVGVRGMARMFENTAVASPPTTNRGAKIPPQKLAEVDSGVVTEHLLPVNRLSRMFDHPSPAAASPVHSREPSLTVHRARPTHSGSIGTVRTNATSFSVSVPGANNRVDPPASTGVRSLRTHGRPPPPPPPSKPSYLSANASGNSRRTSVISDPGSLGSPHNEEAPSSWSDTLQKDRNISQSQPINPFGDQERTGIQNGRRTSRPVSAYIEPQRDEAGENTPKMSISDRIAAFQSIPVPQNPGLKPPTTSTVRSTSPSVRFVPALSPSYSQRLPPAPPPASKSSKAPETATLRIPSTSDRGSSDDDQQPQPHSTTPRAQRPTFPLRLPLPISSSSARSSVADDSTPTTTTTPTAFPPLSPPISASGRSPLPYSPGRFPPLSTEDTEDTQSVATTMSGTVAMTEEERRALREEKRRKVLDELASTERTFWNDMEVLKEAYCIPATETQKLSQQDIRILFANLEQIIELARTMALTLETSIEETDCIGSVFLKMMPRIEETYGDYCRQNEAAVVRLGELASPDCPQDVRDFLKSCQLKLVGRTQAWDLPSLVIKPVQRVLKYPLLIRELIKYTDPSHPDFENLVTVAQQIEKVAEKINELKKRKDVVDKYIADKTKTNLIHGVTKKVNRGVQGLKQATGIAGAQTTVDSEYSDLADTFQKTWDAVKTFKRLVEEDWLRNLKNAVDYQSEIGAEVVAIYSMGSGSAALGPRKSRSDSVASDAASHAATASSVLRVTEYSEAVSRLGMLPWREAETRVKASLCPTIDNLLMLFEHPSKLMKKRNQKQLDFDRYRTLVPNAIKPDGKLCPPPVASGDDVKTLFESADMFPSLNAQLIEELPQFLKLARIAMMGIVNELADIQRDAFAQVLHGVQAAVGNWGLEEGGKRRKRRDTEDDAEEWGRRMMDVWKRRVVDNDELQDSFAEMGLFRKLYVELWGEPPAGSVRSSIQTASGTEPMQQRSPNLLKRTMGNLISPKEKEESPSMMRVRMSMAGGNGYASGTRNASPRGEIQLSTGRDSRPNSITSLSSGGSGADTYNRSSVSGRMRTGTLVDIDDGRSMSRRYPQAVVQYDFEPEVQGELRLKEGTVVEVIRRRGRFDEGLFGDDGDEEGGAEDGWWFGRIVGDGAAGWFPAAYVELR